MVPHPRGGTTHGGLLPLLWFTLPHRPILPGTVRLVAQWGHTSPPPGSILNKSTNRSEPCSSPTPTPTVAPSYRQPWQTSPSGNWQSRHDANGFARVWNQPPWAGAPGTSATGTEPPGGQPPPFFVPASLGVGSTSNLAQHPPPPPILGSTSNLARRPPPSRLTLCQLGHCPDLGARPSTGAPDAVG